ncbi:hypothetical protein [Limosilactobacillus ingluviei]|uniref:hypothetical protein n=1 Tax=Limosilactobacillus ingluviei TaxID=148604 RepID=UPI0024BAD4EC|nr:hypothetical protein [Limosilactobacillus ingluviei]
MDIQDQLNRAYVNRAIYTSGFYADPTNPLDARDKLFDALKSFVENQDPTAAFSLQVMLTNGEINVMPLGLLDLADLKKYESQQRAEHGLANSDESIPLVINFAPHQEDQPQQRKLVGTVQELFADFNQQFPKIWAVVQVDLATNQEILQSEINDLIAMGAEAQSGYLTQLRQQTPAEREQSVGIALADADVDHFAAFLADMHAVQLITLSAARFTKQEIIADSLFAQALADNVRRSTFFWVLDNTFYQIYFYYLIRYQADQPKLAKRLKHRKSKWLVAMRQTSFDRFKQSQENPTAAVDCEKLFSDLFIPVAKQIAAVATDDNEATQ